MSLTSWRGGNRRGAFDPYSFDVWDPFDFTGSLWEQFTPRDRQGGAQDAAAIANTQIDWKETPDAHIFKADLPGMRKDEVKVQIEEGRVLQIHGERTKEDVQNNDKWHRVERQHGSFMRRFRLPDNAKLDEVKATMEDGVLTVTVPKAPHPKPEVKAIDINCSG